MTVERSSSIRIAACMKCGGTELKAIHTSRGGFIASYHCRDCGHAGPVVSFDSLEDYSEFKRALQND
jgi:predicted RNA-binding Zn-ribbon protein involved in translation (DUF1610 family)